MACSTCMSIRQALNSAVLSPLGLPTLPVQTSAPPTPIASPTTPRVNAAWPTRNP